MHEDYHQPGDTPDKIDYDKAARVVRMVVRMIDQLQTTELDLEPAPAPEPEAAPATEAAPEPEVHESATPAAAAEAVPAAAGSD